MQRNIEIAVWQTMNGTYPWMVGLTPEQLKLAKASIEERVVARGCYVCRSGEPARYWYGVMEGLVKMSIATTEGKPASFIGIASGGWFGEGTLLKNELRRYDIVALRSTHLALIPRATFMWLVDVSLSFNRWLLNQLNERLSQFIALLADDRLRNNDARIASTMAWMFNPYLYPKMTRVIPISQEEIAHLAGVSRPRTNEALHRLENAKLIHVGYAHVTVLDIEGLRNFEG